MRLNLSGNLLSVIRKESFRELNHLQYLDLSYCNLEILESGAFNGLADLKLLRLNNNLLSKLLSQSLPLNSHINELTLHDNPWICDCGLKFLLDWLSRFEQKVIQMEPFCIAPLEMQGKPIWYVENTDIFCSPKIILEELIKVYVGQNITLSCEIQHTQELNITWLRNDEDLVMKTKHLKHEKRR